MVWAIFLAPVLQTTTHRSQYLEKSKKRFGYSFWRAIFQQPHPEFCFLQLFKVVRVIFPAICFSYNRVRGGGAVSKNSPKQFGPFFWGPFLQTTKPEAKEDLGGFSVTCCINHHSWRPFSENPWLRLFGPKTISSLKTFWGLKRR